MVDPKETHSEAPSFTRDSTHKFPPFLGGDVVRAARNRLTIHFPEIMTESNGRQTPVVDDATFLTIAAASEGNNPLDEFDSLLPLERKQAILKDHFDHWSAREAWRKRFQNGRKAKLLTPETIREPQWATIAPARPVVFRYSSSDSEALLQKQAQLNAQGLHYEVEERDGMTFLTIFGPRMMTAFNKQQCPFPCTYCTLPGANDAVRAYEEEHGEITPEIQLESFLRALEIAEVDKVHPIVIEVLNDGSWYSPSEIDPRTRELIVNEVVKKQYVQTLAVESRPQYIKPQLIQTDLSRLRPDQQLKLYVGLETTDDFIASVIRKRYGWDEFEAAVLKISETLPPDQLSRITIVAYNIMKQWCNSDREALEESLHLVHKVHALSQRTGIHMEVKHEPTIISKGTDQHYFFHHFDERGERLYENFSYFTVAELIARLAEEGGNLTDLIAFGQRDDIDDIETNAMVARLDNPLLYSSLDFLVYDAVQRFQTEGNLKEFITTIHTALRKASGEWTEEFLAWERKLYGDSPSALRRLCEQNPLDQFSIPEQAQVAQQEAIRSLITQLETDPQLQDLASQDDRVGLREAVGSKFKSVASRVGYEFFAVKNVIEVDVAREDVNPPPQAQLPTRGYQIETIILRNGLPSNIWFFVPKHDSFEV